MNEWMKSPRFKQKLFVDFSREASQAFKMFLIRPLTSAEESKIVYNGTQRRDDWFLGALFAIAVIVSRSNDNKQNGS